MRAFIALHLSDDVVKELIRAQNELRDFDKYANYTRRENLHLTLAFIGETERTDDIARIMEECVGDEFQLTVDQSGNFGGELFWVGAEKTPPLAELAKRLRHSLTENGFDIDKKDFVPHITIARQVRSAEGVRLQVKKKTMTVSEISLMKSERIGGKLVYTKVKTVPLHTALS